MGARICSKTEVAEIRTQMDRARTKPIKAIDGDDDFVS